MGNPLTTIIASISSAAVASVITYIITKNKFEKEEAVRIGAIRAEYAKHSENDESKEENSEEKDLDLPMANKVPEGLYTPVDTHVTEYAETLKQSGYIPPDGKVVESDTTIPYIIDEDTYAAHGCPHMRLDWYPEVTALIIAEGEEAGTPVGWRNFTVGDHNLDKMIEGENDFIIVHNPTQNYDYEIFRYSGKPDYNRYTMSSPFGGDPEGGD